MILSWELGTPSLEKAIQSIPAERNEDGINIDQTNKQTNKKLEGGGKESKHIKPKSFVQIIERIEVEETSLNKNFSKTSCSRVSLPLPLILQ